MTTQLFALLAIFVCCSTSYAEEAVEIPLSEIWAHQMPGTRKIAELMSNPESEDSLLGQIGKKHGTGGWERRTDAAFAVEGTGLEALKNANAVITERAPRTNVLKQGEEASIVFFTLYVGCYVHLSKVEIVGNTIHVRYEVIPHLTRDLTQHFAIIPVGKLPKGKFKVEITAEPLAKRFIEYGFKEAVYERTQHRTSSSFEFQVE